MNSHGAKLVNLEVFVNVPTPASVAKSESCPVNGLRRMPDRCRSEEELRKPRQRWPGHVDAVMRLDVNIAMKGGSPGGTRPERFKFAAKRVDPRLMSGTRDRRVLLAVESVLRRQLLGIDCPVPVSESHSGVLQRARESGSGFNAQEHARNKGIAESVGENCQCII